MSIELIHISGSHLCNLSMKCLGKVVIPFFIYYGAKTSLLESTGARVISRQGRGQLMFDEFRTDILVTIP